MAHDPHDPFDDPALRAAVRRAEGGHRASPALRGRIEGLMQREGARVDRRRRITEWTAATAAVLVVSGLILSQTVFRPSEPPVPVETNSGPSHPVLTQLADAQAGRTALTIGVAVPATQPAAVEDTLARQLGRPVKVPDWAAAGWAIQSADVVDIGPFKAGRVKYASGCETVSVLSMPAAAFEVGCEPLAPQFDAVIHNNPVSGVRAGDAIWCVVGDPGVGADTVKQLRDKLPR